MYVFIILLYKSVNKQQYLEMSMLVNIYGYMFRLILSHIQANMVTEFRYENAHLMGYHYVYKVFRKIKIIAHSYHYIDPSLFYLTQLFVNNFV
jgi:hypothetical protein